MIASGLSREGKTKTFLSFFFSACALENFLLTNKQLPSWRSFYRLYFMYNIMMMMMVANTLRSNEHFAYHLVSIGHY